MRMNTPLLGVISTMEQKKLSPAIAAEAFEKDTTPTPEYPLYECSSSITGAVEIIGFGRAAVWDGVRSLGK